MSHAAASCVQVGDEVVVSTSSYEASETEKHVIAAVSSDGRVLTLNQPLAHTHIGQFHDTKLDLQTFY